MALVREPGGGGDLRRRFSVGQSQARLLNALEVEVGMGRQPGRLAEAAREMGAAGAAMGGDPRYAQPLFV